MLNETQRRAREAAVCEAVLRLLEQGSDFSSLTVSRIAGAAGIGKGTVYGYFPSKTEILRRLTAYCAENEAGRLEALLAPCAALDAAAEAMANYLRELARSRLAAYQIVVRLLVQNGGPPPSGEAPALLARLRGILLALAGRLRAAGELGDVQDDYFLQVVAAAWLPCLLAFSPCRTLPPGPDLGAMLERARRMMVRALR
ncbi:MAG: TetR/AcrR family transcriptional regulator [Gemmiger sp.]